jgi:hypothetical protein
MSNAAAGPESADALDIEVGATHGDLRYWRAKEAVRQGELRLATQAAIRTAWEARATAITGWAAISLLAATGEGFTAQDTAGFAGATPTLEIDLSTCNEVHEAVMARRSSGIACDAMRA